MGPRKGGRALKREGARGGGRYEGWWGVTSAQRGRGGEAE